MATEAGLSATDAGAWRLLQLLLCHCRARHVGRVLYLEHRLRYLTLALEDSRAEARRLRELLEEE